MILHLPAFDNACISAANRSVPLAMEMRPWFCSDPACGHKNVQWSIRRRDGGLVDIVVCSGTDAGTELLDIYGQAGPASFEQIEEIVRYR